MIGAGTVINPIIKIITTVAILGAVYLFLVKPALDTTENITNSVNESIQGSFESFDTFPTDVQDQINDAIDDSGQSDKLVKCIQKAEQNVNKVQACVNRFG